MLRVVRKGALVGTYTTATVPAKKGSGGPADVVRLDAPPSQNGLPRALVKTAYGLALVFAPQNASAQSLWPAMGACFQEWMKYAAAAATLVYVESLIDAAPYLTPVLAMQFVGAAALLGAAEDLLLSCMILHQPGPFHYDGGSGQQEGAGGSGGGSSPTNFDCLQGSLRGSLHHCVHSLGGRHHGSSTGASLDRHSAHADRRRGMSCVRNSVGGRASSGRQAAAADPRRGALDTRRSMATGCRAGGGLRRTWTLGQCGRSDCTRAQRAVRCALLSSGPTGHGSTEPIPILAAAFFALAAALLQQSRARAFRVVTVTRSNALASGKVRARFVVGES